MTTGTTDSWCATSVDSNGYKVTGAFAYCKDVCPHDTEYRKWAGLKEEKAAIIAPPVPVIAPKPKAPCKCHFPFGYGNPVVKYNHCTNYDMTTGTTDSWCATSVDSNGYKKTGAFGYCKDVCPDDTEYKKWAGLK